MCIASIAIGEISTPTQDKKKRKRPKIKGKLVNKDIEFLIDTGALVSVCSEKLFSASWNNWNARRLPLPPALRLSGVTGHDINIVDYVEMEVEIKGKTIPRPCLLYTSDAADE